ncbi:butyrophilin subfamily 1 member A1-like [Terrapene carolina triunguis]|uniref:butyrophilin subfamily 1 member A1-like n=1 Tax=Terrapene triunguis TaxID=2587831 RepID=UPI0011561CCD|nr:butyrophilin subfamily 1 member A1-like [Terrapene carolina triunguis]
MMGKVPSFSPGSTVSSALPGYVAFCLILQVHRLVSAQFTVTGPNHPVIASLGGEAVLYCRLSPRMSAENMEVRWFRSKYSEVVHLYRGGRDQYGEQMLKYQGRTELLKDDITNGRVSLRIRNIRPSDDGQYKCFFQSSVSYEEALLELQVAGLGSDPVISVEGHQDGGIRVVCRSSRWYPEPEAQWRDLQGQILPTAAKEITPEADDLFQTEIAIVIPEESNQKVSCCVRNLRLNQKRESAISVAETLRSDKESEKETLLSEQEQEKAEYEAVKELGLSRAQGYAVDVTLHPDTANPNLVLSEGRKHVKHGNWDPRNKSEGFEHDIWVLGAEGFTEGRRYWEVEVGGKIGWYLGVCREPVSRKEKVTLTPEDGYWVVWLKGGVYQALTSPSTSLPVSIRPSRVGIFLDYEAGEVSFYNVTDRSRLFTFTDTFSGTLRPYFSPGYYVWGTNVAPLKICPVPAQAGGTLSLTVTPTAQTGPFKHCCSSRPQCFI